MKLSSLGGTAATQSGAARAAPSSAISSASVAEAQVQVGAQAESVQAAQQALAAMPVLDMARVAEIKEALARGDIGFDPQKLARLIARHHGGQG